MSTIRIFLGIICGVALGCSTEPSGGVLEAPLQARLDGERSTGRICEERNGRVCKNVRHGEERNVWRRHGEERRTGCRHCEERSDEAICFPSLRGTKQSPLESCFGDCFVPRNDEHPRNDGVPRNESRQKIISIAQSQLGIRELTGKNDGPQIEEYLSVAHIGKGNPWCAAFVSWVFKKAGYDRPRTAWSPALFPQKRRTTIPHPADVLGIYSMKLKRIAHAGFVERRQNDWIISIEGNTNADGSREGDGVYRKRRHLKTIAKFANWLNEN